MLGHYNLALEKHTLNLIDCELYLLIPGLYWQDNTDEGNGAAVSIRWLYAGSPRGVCGK